VAASEPVPKGIELGKRAADGAFAAAGALPTSVFARVAPRIAFATAQTGSAAGRSVKPRASGPTHRNSKKEIP